MLVVPIWYQYRCSFEIHNSGSRIFTFIGFYDFMDHKYFCCTDKIWILLWSNLWPAHWCPGKDFKIWLWNSLIFKAKLNVDKVRFEWGGCIYAGWVVACLEICTAGGMWHFRGFAPERRQEKDNEIQENLLSDFIGNFIGGTTLEYIIW